MEVRIQSKEPIIINNDTRSGKTESGIIEIEITKVEFNPKTMSWKLIVVDYLVTEVSASELTEAYISSERISRKEVIKTSQEMDGLFSLLGSIDSSDTFNTRLISGLLGETQQSPVYGTAPDQWQIKPQP